jgi:hypothetical protein
MRLATLLLLLGAFGCGNGSSTCAPAMPSTSACPAAVFVNAATNDPICLASSGLPLCRGTGPNDAVCYICSGADFSDGCTIKNASETIECVHHCGAC